MLKACFVAWCFVEFSASTGRLIFRSFVRELSRCQMFGRSMETTHPVLVLVQGGQGWGQEDRRSQGWTARLWEWRDRGPAEYRATIFRRRSSYRRPVGDRKSVV